MTCTPSTPAPARKRRRPNQDLVERLARCEELLKQYAGGPAPSGPPAPKPSDPLTPSTAEDVPEPPSTVSSAFPEDVPPLWKGGGKIVKDEAGGRFMDSYVWATVMDQVSTRLARASAPLVAYRLPPIAHPLTCSVASCDEGNCRCGGP